MITTAFLAEKDIEKCLEIYNYYIKNTSFSLEEEELSLEAYRARVAGITKKYPFIVAHDGSGEAVGFAYLNVFNERSAYRHTADLSIYVDNHRTHEHIGEILRDLLLSEKAHIKIASLQEIPKNSLQAIDITREF